MNKLLNLTISFSNICNFSCTYCLTKYGKDELNIFSDKKIILSEIAITNLVNSIKDTINLDPNIKIFISLVGGEPLIHKDRIYFLLEQLSSHGISRNQFYKIEFITNAIFIDKVFCDTLSKYDYPYYFRCSTHFLSEISTKNTEKLYTKAIQFLEEYKFGFQMSFVLSEYLVLSNIDALFYYVSVSNPKKVELLIDIYNPVSFLKNPEVLSHYTRNLIKIFHFFLSLAFLHKRIDKNILLKNFASFLPGVEQGESCNYNYDGFYMTLMVVPSGKTYSCSLVSHISDSSKHDLVYLFDYSKEPILLESYRERYEYIKTVSPTIYCPSKDGKESKLFFYPVLSKVFSKLQETYHLDPQGEDM